MTCCIVESEAESMEFLYHYITIYWTVMYFELAFCPVHDFLTSHIGHLENIGSLGYTALQNVDMCHYIVWITFVNITTEVTRTFFRYWEVVKLAVTDTSSKILIFAEKFDFSLKVTSSLCSFSRKYLGMLVDITTVYLSIILSVCVLWKKSMVQLVTPSLKCFSLRFQDSVYCCPDTGWQPTYSLCGFHFITWNIKKTCTQESRFNINYFTALSSTFLSEAFF